MAYIGSKPANKVLTASDITDGIVSNAKLAQDIISGDTALGATPADTDEFLVSDAGTLKRVDYSYIKGGITEIDYWRLSADTSGTGDSSYAVISSNWERVDTDDFNVKGTGLTQSSGVFTFPSTGYYKIDFWFMNVASAGNYVRIQCQIDPQDGGGYSTAFDAQAGTTDAEYGQAGGSLIFDIPNVSHTMRFRNSTSSSNLRGDSSKTESGFTCIRIGDT